MKAGIVIAIVVVIGLLFWFAQKRKSGELQQQVASQINLGQLRPLMDQLEDGKMEYGFFGITSEGTDCLYFAFEEDAINIEFEVMVNEQKPFVDKLKTYADSKGISVVKMTYGNKPQYPELAQAPVYKLTINATSAQATEIGVDIMKTVFGKNDQVLFDVVP